jgi:hypothetical protein
LARARLGSEVSLEPHALSKGWVYYLSLEPAISPFDLREFNFLLSYSNDPVGKPRPRQPLLERGYFGFDLVQQAAQREGWTLNCLSF